MDKTKLIAAGTAFQGIEKLIDLNALVLDTNKYECEVQPDLWTIWATDDDVTHLANVCRNIMMYCDTEVSRLAGEKVVGHYQSDLIFHALDKENRYYLGRFNRTTGLLLPE